MNQSKNTGWRPIEPPRKLNRWENAIIQRIVEAEFPQRNQILSQLPHVEVVEESIDSPSIIMSVRGDVDLILDRDGIPQTSVIPIELTSQDSDGVPIGVVLNCRGGRLHFLDVYRYDGHAIKSAPDPRSFEIDHLV